ncbi:DUF3347 domain-containing protein [Marinoscillum sp. 108]|uniref:DUF3347 domain-containing protein n=1 Tax=Marinoscillum sp. 108 TaxID=2653151 RepID=UPI00135BC053|nr:DUF3347 domain-containing protein [Marinoscillum sp. 108]
MKKYILSLGLVSLLMACSNPNNERQNESQVSAVPELEEVLVAQSSALSDYMILKDALVKTDRDQAKNAAGKLAKSAASENWNTDIIKAAEVIATSEDVETQRTAFKKASDSLIVMLKANGANDGIYVQYCPMAFGTGANWLSMSEEIRNPYFGDKMLKCGRVEGKL